MRLKLCMVGWVGFLLLKAGLLQAEWQPWGSVKLRTWQRVSTGVDPHSKGGGMQFSESESSLSPIFSLGLHGDEDAPIEWGLWTNYQKINIEPGNAGQRLVTQFFYHDSLSTALVQESFSGGGYGQWQIHNSFSVGAVGVARFVRNDWGDAVPVHFRQEAFYPYVRWHWNHKHSSSLYMILSQFNDLFDAHESYVTYKGPSFGLKHHWQKPWPKAAVTLDIRHRVETSPDIWRHHTSLGYGLRIEQKWRENFLVTLSHESYRKKFLHPIRRIAGCGERDDLLTDYDSPDLCRIVDYEQYWATAAHWKFAAQWVLRTTFEVEETHNFAIDEFQELDRWFVVSLAWQIGRKRTEDSLEGGAFERFGKEHW